MHLLQEDKWLFRFKHFEHWNIKFPQSLEFVSRCRDSQIQVPENYLDL